MQAHKGSNGSFEAPSLIQIRDETPPLEEQEAAWASQNQVGVAGQGAVQQVPNQDTQVSQGGQWNMSHDCHMIHYIMLYLQPQRSPQRK